MPKNKRFGELLSVGLDSVAGRQGKTKRAVQEDLGQKIGVSADAIAWHMKGNIPEPERLENIIHYIVKNGFVNYPWADSLLFQAQYPDRTGLLNQLFRSEDGAPLPEQGFTPPLPKFNTLVLKDLTTPGGAVRLRDEFYVEREADAQLNREIIKPGATITIRAPRQTGKTSLLYRGLDYAHRNGLKLVDLDMQGINLNTLTSVDRFMRFVAEFMFDELLLDPAPIQQAWSSTLPPNKKLTNLLRRHLLPQLETPLVLSIDEADRLLCTEFSEDFFGLIRFWHNMRARDERWDKLNIALVISTEPHLLIRDLSQSPFNVGYKIYLEDFNRKQVWSLNLRHGSPLAESEIDRFMLLFNGHPYLTRMALYTLVADNITWPELVNRAAHNDGPFGGHLQHYQQRLLLHDGTLKAFFKEIIYHNRCSNQQAFNSLIQAGLVKGTNQACVCRCDLYRIYFKDKL